MDKGVNMYVLSDGFRTENVEICRFASSTTPLFAQSFNIEPFQ